MDEIAGAISLAKVAVLGETLLALDGGVDHLEVELLLDERVILPEVFHESIAMAIICVKAYVLACSQNLTSTFSVFLLSKVIFIMIELSG